MYPTKFTTVVIVAMLAALPLVPLTHAQGDLGPFGSDPAAREQSRGRNIETCSAGMKQFLFAGLGRQGFADYLLDFRLWPAHYADVAAVENQLNKARYAVISAFLRCDLSRLKSVTDAYYKLEAELYFVRHYVDTSAGYVDNKVADPVKKQQFVNELVDHVLALKGSGDEAADRALYSGYFEVFAGKYAERVKGYKNFGDDPVFQELGAKFDELIKTFKDLTTAGSAAEKETNKKKDEKKKKDDTIQKTPAHEGTLRTLKAAAAAVASKLALCVETPEDRACLGVGQELPEDPFSSPSLKKTFEKRTYEDVKIAIEQREVVRGEELTKAEMLTRYELLYGQVSGDGVRALTQRIDALEKILGTGTNERAGSLEPLKKLNECVQYVQQQQCK